MSAIIEAPQNNEMKLTSGDGNVWCTLQLISVFGRPRGGEADRALSSR